MKILLTGATGNVGNYVGRKLFELGHELIVVSRSMKKAELYVEFPAKHIEHDLVSSPLPAEVLNGVQVIIHLMGETIDGRWTSDKKKLIYDTRIKSSQNLIQNLPGSVQTIISASAQGIYGDRGDEILSESSKMGADFLAQVCADWEKPFLNLENKNIRTVQLRIGLVLDHQSGALKKMIPMFQKGIGGRLSHGDQFMSWISIEDLAHIVAEATSNLNYSGPINCSADSVKNKDWTKYLAQSLNAFESVPAPAFALKLILGEMSSLLLSSTRMSSEKLKKLGFVFKYDNLEKYFNEKLSNFRNNQGLIYVHQYVPYSIDKVFPFFAEANNLEKITPAMLNFKIAHQSTDKIQQGTYIDYNLKIHGFPAKWKTLIDEWNPPFQFVDTQVKGPYSLWHHTHQFEKMGSGTLMTDLVRYRLPFGFLGNTVAGAFVQQDVESIFKYRREIMAEIKF